MATVKLGPFQRIVGFHFNSDPWVGYGTFQWGTASGFYDVYSPSHGSSPQVVVFCFVFSKLNFPALWMAKANIAKISWYTMDIKDETGSWVPVRRWLDNPLQLTGYWKRDTWQFWDNNSEHYYLNRVEIAGRTIQPHPPDTYLRDLDDGLILFGFQDYDYFNQPENKSRLVGKDIRITLHNQ